jgi:ADP-heptose:LPS heptosyltransferase
MRRLVAVSASLGAGDFPQGTPLHAFFAWNEARFFRDRRYVVARDIHALHRHFGGGAAARELCAAHLALRPRILWRWGRRVLLRENGPAAAPRDRQAAAAAEDLVDAVLAAIGSADVAAQAEVFRRFDELEERVDLAALARRRPRWRAAPPPRRRAVLVIKLSAFGDFVQALGPAAAIRRRHAGDRITLLTTEPFRALAAATGLFDEIVIDRRARLLDLAGWLALRRFLRGGGFDRVYDLQTSDRSSFYSFLFLPGARPQWSGIAWRCSHPHANLDRDPQHTIDKQAEQLLMAGIYPVPLPACPAATESLPAALRGRRYALLIPGSSPRHPDKRWPAERYAALGRYLDEAGYFPVIVGASDERSVGAAITAACPAALDFVGATDLPMLARLAAGAALTVGNDTGATHLAAAAGGPIVVLFSRASDPARCAPRGRVRVLAMPDLADLDVETVLAAIRQLLTQPEAVSAVKKP